MAVIGSHVLACMGVSNGSTRVPCTGLHGGSDWPFTRMDKRPNVSLDNSELTVWANYLSKRKELMEKVLCGVKE